MVFAAPLAVAACSSFGGDDPPAFSSDASAVEGGSGSETGLVDVDPEGGTTDATPALLDAGADGPRLPVDCVNAPGVDFCSDFDTSGLTPWNVTSDPTSLLKTVSSGAAGNQRLSIPIPTDSQPIVAFIHRDVPSAKSFRFGLDVSLPATPAGDYVSWLTIDALPLKTAFSLELRIDADSTLSAYESGAKVASLGALPTSGMVRFEGTVTFDASVTAIALRRNGTPLATMSRPGRAAPAGLRLSLGLVYAEASGGGTIAVDNVVFDTP